MPSDTQRADPSFGSFPWRIFLLMAALFLLQALPNLWGNNMCGDEGLELTDGYFIGAGIC